VKSLRANERVASRREPRRDLITAMLESGFYPKPPPAEVIHKETHISDVFLAGERVYKVKKPVRFSFLDYSTLARRRHFLHEELRLNRRLAPSVYLAIVPITREGKRWRLGGEEKAIEYALVMRRLPEKRFLSSLLETRQVTPAMMTELAELLARFHSQAEKVESTNGAHYVEALKSQWSENLADFEPFRGTLIDNETLDVLKDFGARFIEGRRDLLMRRAEDGWVRDVHGDLHCEHVCFAPTGIQIFDCIEFSADLRQCDLASEIAFLTMDLEARGGESLVGDFLGPYGALLGDRDLRDLLPFYKCYRALVRSKVHALRSQAADSTAAHYCRFAIRYTWEPLKPFLLIIGGLTGSGKSTLARELGTRLGMPVINSDAVRKGMAGKSARGIARFNEGIYSPRVTEQTHEKMAREAEKQISRGTGAVLDATFGRRAHREAILRLAERHKIPLAVIICFASEEATKARLDRRAAAGKDISDGRWEIYLEQKPAYEPLVEMPSGWFLEMNTERPLGEITRACERFLRSRLLRTVER
jgi:uncharacterized protein